MKIRLRNKEIIFSALIAILLEFPCGMETGVHAAESIPRPHVFRHVIGEFAATTDVGCLGAIAREKAIIDIYIKLGQELKGMSTRAFGPFSEKILLFLRPTSFGGYHIDVYCTKSGERFPPGAIERLQNAIAHRIGELADSYVVPGGVIKTETINDRLSLISAFENIEAKDILNSVLEMSFDGNVHVVAVHGGFNLHLVGSASSVRLSSKQEDEFVRRIKQRLSELRDEHLQRMADRSRRDQERRKDGVYEAPPIPFEFNLDSPLKTDQ